jgi:hypothetical protein
MIKKYRTLIKAILQGISLCGIVLLSLNCIENPLTPVAPSSDIVLQGISVIDITKYFSEMVSKSEGMVINTDGTMSYITTQYSNPVKIDSIKMAMSPSGQQVGVGLFSIAALPSSNQNVTLAQMGLSPIDYPGANSTLPGIPPPFPASYVSLPGDTSLNYSSQFDYAAINSGTMTLSFTNNLPLKITFNKPIILRNNQLTPFLDTSWIAAFSPGTLDSNGMVNAIYNGTQSLAGKILRSRMKFDSVSFTTESRSTPFSLTLSNGISVQFSSTTLYADSAAAVVPSQTLQSIKDSSVIMDDTVIVQNAYFSAGSFSLVIVNNLGIDVGAEFIIKGLLLNGSDYTYDKIIQGKTTDSTIILGSQLGMQPQVIPATGIGSQLIYSVGIKTIDSKGLKKPITKNDFVKASLIPGPPLVLKSITGKIKTQTIVMNTGMASGFKDFTQMTADSIKLKGIGLTVRFPMTGGYPMDYDLTVSAKSKGSLVGNPIVIKSGANGFQRIFPTNPIIPISNAPDFDNFLSKFFPTPPDSFYVNGTVTLNPDFASAGNYSTYDTTKIYPAFDMNFPFSVGISNGRTTDVLGFTKGEVPKDFTKAVVDGRIAFNFVNLIPLKMAFRATFLGNYDTPSRSDDTLLVITPSDSVRAGQVDVNTGYSSAPTVSKVVIALNGTQMAQFNKADSLQVQFNLGTGTNGQVVKVRQTDYIRVYAKGDITYTVNKP